MVCIVPEVAPGSTVMGHRNLKKAVPGERGRGGAGIGEGGTTDQ